MKHGAASSHQDLWCWQKAIFSLHVLMSVKKDADSVVVTKPNCPRLKIHWNICLLHAVEHMVVKHLLKTKIVLNTSYSKFSCWGIWALISVGDQVNLCVILSYFIESVLSNLDKKKLTVQINVFDQHKGHLRNLILWYTDTLFLIYFDHLNLTVLVYSLHYGFKPFWE